MSDSVKHQPESLSSISRLAVKHQAEMIRKASGAVIQVMSGASRARTDDDGIMSSGL